MGKISYHPSIHQTPYIQLFTASTMFADKVFLFADEIRLFTELIIAFADKVFLFVAGFRLLTEEVLS